MIRAGADLVSEVQDIQRELDEIKTAQFTSQSSGMRFYDVSPEPKVFTIPASQYSGVKITHKFTGIRRKAVLVQRDITITIDGITLKIDEYSAGRTYMYSSGSSYFSVTPYNFKGYSENYEDIQISTIVYSYGSARTVRVTTHTKATDKGTDVISVNIG